MEPVNSVRLDSVSNEYVVTSVVAVKPRKRDFWKVLRGTYQPKVRQVSRLTAAGMSRELKKVWTSDAMRSQFYDESSPLSAFKGEQATVGFVKKTD